MEYTNSSLVGYTKLSPNNSGLRNHAIDTITIHCVVGQCSVETLGNVFAPTSRQASSNYGVGVDGRIGMYCEEKNRSWCSSSASNDNRAITIEVASDTTAPYAVNAKAYAALLDLVTDICKRNDIKQLLWKGDKSLIGQVDKQNMTVHRWFANKSCPGDYLYSRHGEIAAEVNKRLNAVTTPETPSASVLYHVQVGAYSIKENADAQLTKVKAAGFDTYLVKVGDLYKIQVGAYGVKVNADAMLEKVKSAGFDAFVTTVSGTAAKEETVSKPVLKSTDEIAKEVLDGKWGNGDARKTALTNAGYNYSEVQNKVNQLVNANQKSIDDIAREVIQGKWGNGQDRKDRLAAAGYDYSAVQKRVNELL